MDHMIWSLPVVRKLPQRKTFDRIFLCRNPLKCSVSLMIFQFYHDKLGQPISEFGVEQQQDALIQSSKSKEILTKDIFCIL